jgi:hypothetical protein
MRLLGVFVLVVWCDCSILDGRGSGGLLCVHLSVSTVPRQGVLSVYILHACTVLLEAAGL